MKMPLHRVPVRRQRHQSSRNCCFQRPARVFAHPPTALTVDVAPWPPVGARSLGSGRTARTSPDACIQRTLTETDYTPVRSKMKVRRVS